MLQGYKTHVTAALILILQALHAAGLVTDKGAMIGSWTLASFVAIFVRMAIADATNTTHAKLDVMATAQPNGGPVG